MKRLLRIGLLSLGLSSFAISDVLAQTAVMVESFRNVNCKNCKDPDVAFEQWIESNHTQYPVDMIYYHNEITDAQDPFYLASEVDVRRRSTDFYKIGNDPYMYVQGFDGSSDENQWINFVKQAAGVPRQAAVEISDIKIDQNNKYSFTATATNTSGRQVRLYAALVESEIQYQNSKLYGQPYSGTWDNIFRKMLPGRDGTAPFGTSMQQTFTFDLAGKTWDIANMKAFVFVQDAAAVSGNSRPIYGHTVVDLSVLKSSVEPVQLNGFSIKSLANPFSASAPIEVRLGQHGHLRLEMFDMTGKMISQLANNSMNEGAYVFDAMQGGLVAGTYLVNAFVDGNYVGQVKIVKN